MVSILVCGNVQRVEHNLWRLPNICVCSSIFYLIKGPLHKLFLGAPNCSVTPLPETKEVYYVVGSAIKTVAYGNLTVTHSGLLTQSGIENILKTLWN